MPASIWLQPAGDADRLLRQAIAELAARHGTVPFQPHLTVCGIPPDDPAVAERAADYVRRCGVLPLRVSRAGISVSTVAPFRAVAIDVADSPELHAFRAGLQQIAAAPAPEPPHISLLYTIGADQSRVSWASDAARLRAVADECAARIAAVELVLGDPVVVAPDGEWTNIRSWNIVRTLS